MGTVRFMRLLRLAYGISLKELAEAAGVSLQYVSDIELGKFKTNRSHENLMQDAFERVIKRRTEQARRLSQSYSDNSHCLLDFITKEDSHEL